MSKTVLTKDELEKLIKDSDPSLKFVQRKKTSKSSEWWNFFHHIFVNNIQQQFVSCSTCKRLLLYSSFNGTNITPALTPKKVSLDCSDSDSEKC